MLEAARQNSVKKFVYASSSSFMETNPIYLKQKGEKVIYFHLMLYLSDVMRNGESNIHYIMA